MLLQLVKNYVRPEDIKPKFNSQDNSFKFRNGSEIHLAGVNGQHADDLRGTNSHLNIVDEAGSIDDLKYLVQSVLIPQTLTTAGMTVMASTPALSQDHEYYSYYEEAKVKGHLSEFTVYDNKSLSLERIAQIAEDCGGEQSTDFLREYMCKWVTDSELAIIPEFEDEYIGQYDRDEFFPFYHKYLAMDLGVVDLTAILYSTYDFRQGKLFIEKEDIINGPEMTTELIHKRITDSEKELWSQSPEVHKRVADNNNLLLLADLSKIHGLYVQATNKDSLEAMVNEVRMFVKQGRLIVDPKCKQLIGCLKFGIWNKKAGKREFARSTALGHYDALAALVYLIRNLDPSLNPIPASYNVNVFETHINKGAFDETDYSDDVAALKKAYGMK